MISMHYSNQAFHEKIFLENELNRLSFNLDSAVETASQMQYFDSE